MRRALWIGWMLLAVVSPLGAQEAIAPPAEPVVEAIVDPTAGPLKEWVVAPLAKPAPPPWSGTAELGLSGADGNSNNFKLRAALTGKYESGPHLFLGDTFYSYASAAPSSTAPSVTTENRLFAKSRYERTIKDSPWSWFLANEVDYDQFKAFDVRVSVHSGFAYTWLKNDRTLIKTRGGAGFSREIGGPSNEFKPELLFGADVEHKLTERTKFVGNLDYFPSMLDLNDYRIQARMLIEFLIDPEWNLSLRLGLLDRYDSTPEGRRPNDIEYFATILWKF